ncbi:MAG TPA: DUF998 domain-containing protein [Egibacteraceae bacterium]|nr:DUF998 domain-containing protein [Egibacteraceae bacterium]
MGRTGTAWGGVVGPVTFISAWAIGGTVEDGYSPIDQAISRLAAIDASARVLMTVGLATLGVGMLLFATALRVGIGGLAWVGAAVTGIVTLGIVATPLGRTATVDQLHAAFAVTGYVSLVAMPMLAAGRLRRKGLARLSLAVGGLAAVCLVGAVSGLFAPGLLQRAGLTLVHVWVVGMAASLLRDSPPVPRDPIDGQWPSQ